MTERKITHGKTDTRAYRIWCGMKKRCKSKKDPNYFIYTRRGIKVCERWEKFENFYEDMGDPPTEKHSIDRIDSDGNYEPSNCRWATWTQQNNNRKNNRLLTLRGQTKTTAEWARKTKINYQTLIKRLRLGWKIERALTEAP